MASLLSEIRENAQRYIANAGVLKSQLYYLADGEDTQPDWDWNWPYDLRLVRVLRRRFDDPRWRASVAQPVAARVDRFYGLILDQPPGMGEWAAEWDGNGNSLYIFIGSKIDALCRDVAEEARNLAIALQEPQSISPLIV